LTAPVHAATLLYTNSPCVYLLTSNAQSQTATLLGPTGSFGGSVSVPVSVKSSLFTVTAVAPGAFKDCGGLTNFALDASSKVSAIGAGAFWGCTNLSAVTLRESVTAIGASAFLGCAALTNVNLAVATGLAAVAQQTFCGCSRLAALSLPEGVVSVGPSAFRGCSSLTNIALPPGVAALPDSAFQECRRLAAASLSGVTALGVNAFAGSGLKSVTIPAGVTNLGQGAFADCTNLASVTYAGSPAAIGSAAFKNCAALTSLPVASSVTSIASTAFEGCARLTSVTLPAGVGELSDNLFENCTSLASVAGAGIVSNVGDYTFAYCANLTNVTFRGDAPDAEGSTFTESGCVFVYYYKGTSGWGNLLADRPTVMLGADGAVEALSFAAWTVRSGLSVVTELSDETLATLFAAEASSAPGLSNGAVFAFGGNLTAADRGSLLRVVFDAEGSPIVETPALTADGSAFVTVAVEGTTDLASGIWDLPLSAVALPDVTRAGYVPAEVNGSLPAAAFFRLKIALRD
jgi:hypothetical protein